MKKILTLFLAAVLVLGMFSGCGAAPATQPTTEATMPAPTQSPEEAAVLKILTLGHSLAVDCGHMLAAIAAAEGYKELKVGTLYYSGCPLYKHVSFMETDATEYKLYISSSENPSATPEIMESVTMRNALRFDYWDIIIMQGGVFEIAYDDKYTDGNITKIIDFVNQNKMNPNATFAWHMAWAPPTNNELRDQYPYEDNTYYTSYVPFSDNRDSLYAAICKAVQNNIVTNETFQFVIPTGTAMENALSSYLEETDLHRDYVHASDLARVMVSYLWYCKLAGIEKLEELKFTTIPKQFFKSTQGFEDRVLTEAEQAIILEAVNNALANPFQMTPSQYTTAPTE